jgi:ankyrin repeat protein
MINVKRHWVLSGVLAIVATTVVATLATFLEKDVNRIVLPDYDSGQPAILRFADGALQPPPVTSGDDAMARVSELGDLAYDYTEVPHLFVSSGQVGRVDEKTLAAGRFDPAEVILQDLDLGGDALVPGSVWLARRGDGGLTLFRILRVDRRGLEIEWLNAAAADSEFPQPLVAKLLSRRLGLQSGRVVFALDDDDPDQAFNLDGQHEASVRWPATLEPVEIISGALRGSADIAPVVVAGVRHLALASGRYALLGRGDLADYVANAKTRDAVLSGAPVILGNYLTEGSVFLIKTRADRHALLRVDARDDESMAISWIYQPDGSRNFGAPEAKQPTPTLAVDTSRTDPNATLLGAARSGAYAQIDDLLAAGADVNAVNRQGFTVLQLAITRGDARTIDALLAAGADPEKPSKYGWNALHLAAQYGNMQLVERFLERGMDAGMQTPDGQTALQIAAASPRSNADVIDLLQASSHESMSIFDAAAIDDVALLETLLPRSDIDAVDARGKTALVLAVDNGSAAAVSSLVEAGANPTIAAPNRYGDALAVAARNDAGDILMTLLASPLVDEDSRDEALYVAIVNQKPAAMAVLIDAGADLDRSLHANASLAEQAYRHGNEEIVRVLRDHGVAMPLWAAARLGDVEAMRAALSSGTTPAMRYGVTGESALALAVKSGKPDAVRLLLQRGGNVNAAEANGKTPLQIAVEEKQLAMVTLLLNEGARIDAQSDSGRTPLATASVNGDLEIMRLLLQKGARTDIVPPGYTSLFEVTASEQVHKLLTEYGAAR